MKLKYLYNVKNIYIFFFSESTFDERINFVLINDSVDCLENNLIKNQDGILNKYASVFFPIGNAI